MTQRLLASLLQQVKSTGQKQPQEGDAAAAMGGPSGPPPGPPPQGASQSFAAHTLKGLLDAQSSDRSDDLASKLISALDTDQDGALGADEISQALGQTADDLSSAISSLDSDQDGSLSQSELSSALSAHKHGHARHASSSDMASKLLSDVDTDGDSALSLDEIKSKLGDDTDAGSLTTVFNKLDSDGDGSLNASELATALEAFKSAHGYGQAAAQRTTSSVTA